MMKGRVIAIDDAAARWRDVRAPEWMYWPMHDGSGAILHEYNGKCDSLAYTGTTTNLWTAPRFGVLCAGDGLFPLPSNDALQSLLDLRKPGWHIFSIDIHMAATSTTYTSGAEIVWSMGTDTTTGATTEAGLFRLKLEDSGSDVKTNIVYRNARAGTNLSNQDIEINTDLNVQGDGTNHTRSHVFIGVYVTDELNLVIVPRYNRRPPHDIEPTVNGAGAPYITSATSLAIGGTFGTGTTPSASNPLGSKSSSAKIENLLIAYDPRWKEPDVVRMAFDLWANPGSPPRDL